MKFIHLTDTHVIGEGELYGQDPAARLRAAVASINAEHSDAAFVALTGDMTHWGDTAAYVRFSREIKELDMPLHLIVGNHDDTASFGVAFPEIPRDESGFVQSGFETQFGRFLLLDTKNPETHAGAYCPARQVWLTRELDQTNGPVVLFMHHPPFKTGIASMDRIMLQDAEAFYDIVAPPQGAHPASVLRSCASRHFWQLAGHQLFLHARPKPSGRFGAEWGRRSNCCEFRTSGLQCGDVERRSGHGSFSRF
ncbi:metallophosphoesterase [Roseobacter sp. OBYS 0001]|uniref:metallophosphoesterase n=1 Tax=Roseobacter sp. OBYS 0001 TaxID=882651 RepID=UPI00217F7D20|nr:metallophosphoesterase [Roseobacter sp. OBYS 0001]